MTSAEPVLLRAASADDIPQVVAVHTSSWDAAKEGLDVPSRRTDAERTQQWRSFLAERRGDLVLACDPEPVGFVAFGPSRDEDCQGEVEVYTLYVHPGCWRRGIGRALLAAVPDDRPLSLWVAEGNAASREFYAAQGFAPDGAREEGHHLPVVRLRRQRQADCRCLG